MIAGAARAQYIKQQNVQNINIVPNLCRPVSVAIRLEQLVQTMIKKIIYRVEKRIREKGLLTNEIAVRYKEQRIGIYIEKVTDNTYFS